MNRALAALSLIFALTAQHARADVLAAGLSTDSIQITSSFRGADIVLFGSLISGTNLGALAERDIVVVVKGPVAPIVVRKQARLAGIWINAQEARITGLPGYYYLASSKPLAQIAPSQTLAAMQLGAMQVRAQVAPAMAQADADAFRAAAIRGKARLKLYAEDGAGVERLGHFLFRVRMRLPGGVPPGRYRAEVYLFDKGELIAQSATTLPIRKAGLERRLYDYSQNQPLPYGLATVAMALALGWLGFAAFRRP